MPTRSQRQQMIKRYMEKINDSVSLREAKRIIGQAQYIVELTNDDVENLRTLAIDKFKN
jgi:hypothetical protein